MPATMVFEDDAGGPSAKTIMRGKEIEQNSLNIECDGSKSIGNNMALNTCCYENKQQKAISYLKDSINLRAITPDCTSDNDCSINRNECTPIKCLHRDKQKTNHIKNVSSDEDDSSESSFGSSQDSSWSSSISTPVVRPQAIKAPFPTPDMVSEAHIIQPYRDPKDASKACFSALGSTASGFSIPLRSCRQETLSQKNDLDDESSKESLRNMDSVMGVYDPNSHKKNNSNSRVDIGSILCGAGDCYGIICCDSSGAAKSFSQSIDSGSSTSSNIYHKNRRLVSDNSYSSRRERELMNRSAWWVRRQTRMKRRRRRTSPVFDNMSIVPESPTVSTVSTEQSDSYDSTRSMTHTSRNLFHASTLEKGSHSSKVYRESAACTFSTCIDKDPKSEMNEVTISVVKPYTCTHDTTVPMIVTCENIEDDNYSMSSSLSIFRSDYSDSSYLQHGTTRSIPGSSVQSRSSGSLSLPVLIGPAYKFTPIEYNVSCDNSDVGSYEKQKVIDFDIINYSGDADGDASGQQSKFQYNISTLDKDLEREVWSVFDMPLLLSKTICDWAAGTRVRE